MSKARSKSNTPKPFQKFEKKRSNAAIKEAFRQEKRKVKKEREEYFDNKKKEAAQRKLAEGRSATGRFSSKADNRFGGDEPPPPVTTVKAPTPTGVMPLNKFIAHCGVVARRDAAELVKQGLVKVNGEVVINPAHRVSSKDEVKVNGKKVFLAKNLVYILLNKPKDYITTTDDPQKRKTVLDLIRKATQERVYPVGRLDRNTSGVLLLTNDGLLAQYLTHPSNNVRKVYAVTLDKPLEKADFDKILQGVVLDDGPASVDVLAYADSKDKRQIGVEIHSGRNRIVRRIFESLGYDVKGLDRVMFAGLTKKNIERGRYRFLNEKEVLNLKHLGKKAK